MKQVTPPRRQPYTRFELENKEGVTMTIYFGVDFHARQQFRVREVKVGSIKQPLPNLY
jgi:hypothetical protein